MLSAKRRAFVREYVTDYNAAQAAIRAGYSKNGARQRGQKLLTNSDIQKAISEKEAALEERSDWTRDRLIAETAELIRSSKEGNPVLDRYGKLTGKYVTSYSGWSKGIELIGKFTGELTERRDVTTRQATVDKPIEELRQEQRMLEDQLAKHGLDRDGNPLGPKHSGAVTH